MRIVVDTNIVFSSLLNADNDMGDVLLNYQNKFQFFAPQLVLDELLKYHTKLQKLSKLSALNLNEAQTRIFDIITLISLDLIENANWTKAYELTKNIDENDTPFVALALSLEAKLCTGDKILTQGLQKRGMNITINTTALKRALLEK